MRSPFFVLAILVLIPTSVLAQESRVEGYVAGAAGRWSNRFTSGSLAGVTGGVDVAVTPFVAAEFDGSLLASGGLLLGLSPGTKVRFQRWEPQKVMPFVAGGYSYLQFFEGSRHAFNVGGGVEYAFNDSRALRIEVRDMIRRDFPSHYFTVRVGVTFR